MLALLLACAPPVDSPDSPGILDAPSVDSGTHHDGPLPDVDSSFLHLPEPGETLRVMVWNIESLGEPGSIEFRAVSAIISRLDPDVIGINEINGSDDMAALPVLAEETGYEAIFLPEDNPFGSQRNALLARVGGTGAVWTSAALSGDVAANDLTRLPISFHLDAVTVVVNHYKSGTDNASEVRRALDSLRTASIDDGAPLVVMGDFNEEVHTDDASPDAWTTLPGGLPSSWSLGSDLMAQLSSGIPNRVFTPLTDRGLSIIDAARLDGTEATRPESGRRLDYVAVRGLAVEAAEVYHSEDEGLGGGIDKAGSAPDARSSEHASDHLPVVVDLRL